ncbi:MAG: HAD family hydrolase [Bacteroidia bacterium]
MYNMYLCFVQAVRNIIFDLGGVLLNLDYTLTSKAFIALGMRDFDAIYTQAKQVGWFDAFDKGELTAEEFRNLLRTHLPENTSDLSIDLAWNAMLLDLPRKRLDMLRVLGKDYRIFLLSNTNEIHVAAFSNYLQTTYGISDFSDYFERWYYSCRMGMRKPDAEIFQHVLTENKLLAAETLFIDDSIQHIAGAKSIGLQTLFLPAGEEIDLLLKKNEISF